MSNDLCAEQMEGEELKNIIKIYENKEKTPRIYCVPRSFIKVFRSSESEEAQHMKGNPHMKDRKF